MKAIRVSKFGGPEVLQLHDVPELTEGTDEVVVTVKAAGVNPVDTYIRTGTYASASVPDLPYTPGMDGAGIIKTVGPHVKNFSAGDRVYITGSLSGTYAQEALCLSRQIFPLPEALSFEQGAAIGTPYATAYRALFTKAKVVFHETILVHGASGGVGIAAIQLAKIANAKIMATAGSSDGLGLLRAQGADFIFDHTQKGYMDDILRATDGRGVDAILEMLANVNLGEDLKILAKNGRVVVIGCRGSVMINPREAMIRDATIMGMVMTHMTVDEKQKIHEALAEGFKTKRLNPVVGKVFPLSDASKAHEAVLESGAHGKIILSP